MVWILTGKAAAHNDVMRIDVLTSISGSILVPLIEVEVPTTQRTMWRCSKHCVRYLITPEPHLALVSQRLRHIGTCDGMIYLACSSMLTSWIWWLTIFMGFGTVQTRRCKHHQGRIDQISISSSIRTKMFCKSGSIVQAHTNLTEIQLAVDLLWRVNVDPSQVAMGFGFYGRAFTLSDSSCRSFTSQYPHHQSHMC